MTSTTPLSPMGMRDFLKSLGWFQKEEGSQFGIYIFENKNYPGRQLTYPMDMLAPDYGESVDWVLEKLSDLLGETIQTLWRQALALSGDTLRFRLITSKEEQEFLPLADVGEMISGMQQLLRAAAHSVVQPSLYHNRLNNQKADQFIQACRFGHTEPGSFVFRISCPLNAMGDDGGLNYGSEVEPPFTRLVTQKLWQGVHDSVRAIESDTLPDFVNKIKSQDEPMISANFCDALYKLYSDKLDNVVDFSVDWSYKYPSPPVYTKNIRIQPDYFKRIAEVGYELQTRQEPYEDVFIGTVEELKGDPTGTEGERSGEVVLSLITEEKKIRVKTKLSVEQYKMAHKAHMEKNRFIKVEGHLLQGNQPRTFKLSSFDVIDKT